MHEQQFVRPQLSPAGGSWPPHYAPNTFPPQLTTVPEINARTQGHQNEERKGMMIPETAPQPRNNIRPDEGSISFVTPIETSSLILSSPAADTLRSHTGTFPATSSPEPFYHGRDRSHPPSYRSTSCDDATHSVFPSISLTVSV